MAKVFLTYHKNNIAYFSVRGEDAERKKHARGLRAKIVAMQYFKNIDKFKTYINEFETIHKYCVDNNIEFVCDQASYKAYQKWFYYSQYVKRERKNKQLDIELWTKDKDMQLHSYQKRCVNAVIAARKYLIGDQMGLGKTAEAIGIILKSFEEYKHEKALVICPSKLLNQWKNEIEKFTDFPMDKVVVLGEQYKCITGDTDRYDGRIRLCKECKFSNQCKSVRENVGLRREKQIIENQIVITTYDSMKLAEKQIISNGFEVLVFDEGTHLKNTQSGYYKTAKRIVDNLPYDGILTIMSGTFIENRLEELYPVMHLVDPGSVGGLYEFKERYIIYDYWGKVEGYRNLDFLRDKINKLIIRRTADKVWKDRPGKVEYMRECPMEEDQFAFYTKVRDGVIADIEDAKRMKSINNAMMASLIGYLLQVTGTAKAIDPTLEMKNHSSKIEELKNIILEELDSKSKMIIFSRFANLVVPVIHEELTKLNEKAGIGEIGLLTGSTKDPEAIKKDFNEGKYRFLVCSDAVAYGSNLQTANYIVNFDLPWNPAKVDQRIARVYRKGQKKTVFVINLVVPNTVEDHLHNLLNEKRKLQAEMLTQDSSSSSNINLKKLIDKI